MYDWSEEQLHLFSAATSVEEDGDFTHKLIKVKAIAGAAKTSSLVELAKRYTPETSIKYLVFGTANAAEGRESFGTRASVSTLHAMAYHYIFRKYSFPILKNIAPFISWREIPKSLKIPYNTLFLVIDFISAFSASNELSMSTFATDDEQKLVKHASAIMDLMFTGKLRITHGVYLKLFHTLVMTEEIELDPVDVLLIDEFGDITEQTLDIFLAYPAKQKIAVGDPAQSIFSFMNCINGFNYLADRGITVALSQSFRVSNNIAPSIERFCRFTIDDEFVFRGMDYSEPAIKTRAFITRNNIALIDKMIELNKYGTPYRLVSKAKSDQLFKLPLFLISLKAGKTFRDQELSELQKTVDEYYRQRITDVSCFRYVLQVHEDNVNLKKAANVTSKYTAGEIIDAKNNADNHKDTSAQLTLGTAFVFKGFTFDSVELHPELNEGIADAYEKLSMGVDLTPDELTEMKLYYVAATRCRHELINATYIR